MCVVFIRMFMDTPEDERTKLISCLGAFRHYWGTLPQVYIHTHTHTHTHTQTRSHTINLIIMR